jgi:hypothetical protein
MSTEVPSLKSGPRRWAFSLRTLLLVVLVLCVALGFYLTGRRLREAERELRVLRDETGRLSVEDRTQFHAIALDGDEPNTWRWRLFIPKGHRYSWNLAAEDIPQHDPPRRAGTQGISNEPYWEQDNEVLVTARLRRLEDDAWQLSVESRIGDSQHQMYGATLRIPEEKLRWMFGGPGTDGQVLGSRGTATRGPEGPIILLQRRALERQADGSHQPSPGPMPGIMIWLIKEEEL